MSRLLPVLDRVSSLALRAFYRLEVAGAAVPPDGPVLLVANHPNSLLDPAAVSVAARRPVRFLAKAPLFADPKTSWLVRAAGAIPVHRRQDGGSRMEDNLRAFDAVHEALARGDAVGLFPEGRSHSEPELAPLKTGAARIALGAAAAGVRAEGGGALPIVPVGLTLESPHVFRSRALVLVGAPLAWDDLADVADRGDDDAEAVRELTARIDAALRAITLNLERHEDRLAVETAESVHAAEMGRRRETSDRMTRLHEASSLLSHLRATEPEALRELLPSIERHGRTLARLDLDPMRLDETPSRAAVARWIGRQAALAAVSVPVALTGAALFFVPRRLTAWLADRRELPLDARSSWKVLGGAGFHLAWILLLAGLAAFLVGERGGRLAGALAFVATAALLPALAVAHQAAADALADAWLEARRHLRLRGRAELRERLLEERRELGRALERLRSAHAGGTTASRLRDRGEGRPRGPTARRPPRPRR